MGWIRQLQNQRLEKRLIKAVSPFTMVAQTRVHNLYVLAQRVEQENTPGDVVECGVYQGGTAAILARIATRSKLPRTVWLFDSFEGMPPTTPVDGAQAAHWVGKLATTEEQVMKVVRLGGADIRKVRIVRGLFQDSFQSVDIPRIALLNLDCDWYESVRLCLHKFYDSVVPGGFVSFDDYGYWPGCKAAVDEFFVERGLQYPLQRVDDEARWFQKI